MINHKQSSIYGPVQSWRLGWSLGVDVLCVDSICSFECVYCQLGKIHRLTAERNVFVPTAKVLKDLQKFDWKKVDVITFSGSGEPTLAANLGEILNEVKKLTKKKIVVLTNSTLLHLPEVRKELDSADHIFCKLDAWSEETFQRFNHPQEEISLEKVILGIKALQRESKGRLAIQTMILRTPRESEIKNFAQILRFIKPYEVQLNLPTRPIPKDYFLETRGNELMFDHSFKQIKTI